MQRLSSPRATRSTHRKRASCVMYYSKENDLNTKGIDPEPSIGTYASVYDLETGSPFRRIQCQQQSASESCNSPDHEHATRHKSSSNFTWRGMVNGKEEVINTELKRLPILDMNVRCKHHPNNETNKNETVTDLVENKQPLQRAENSDMNTWYSSLSSYSLKTILETEKDDASCISLPAYQNTRQPTFVESESKPSAADAGYTSIQKVFHHNIEARQQGTIEKENADEAMMYSVQVHHGNLS